MAMFDQRNQTVTNQWNYAVSQAADSANDRESLSAAIDELVRLSKKAYGDEQIPDAEFEEVKGNLKLAKAEAQATVPDKSKLVAFLDTAKNAVKDVVAVAGLYEALAKLAEKVPHLPF